MFHGPPERSGFPPWLKLHRRPLLVYGKMGFRPDGMDGLIEVPAPDGPSQGRERNELAMVQVVERFARPGQTVCDPVLLDRSGTALGARKLGCLFIGATRFPSCVQRIRNRLAEGEGK